MSESVKRENKLEKLFELIVKAKNLDMMADDALPAILEAEQLAIEMMQESGLYGKMSKSKEKS